MTNMPSGWHASPDRPGQERYWDGDKWTDAYRPAEGLAASGPPPKKRSKFKLGCLGLIGLVVLIGIIVAATGGGGTDSTSSPTASNQPSKTTAPTKSASPTSAATDANGEQAVKVGAPFQQGDFKFKGGWKVTSIGYGMGNTVKGLVGKNTSSDPKQLFVDFRLYKGNTVTGTISCMTSNQIRAGTSVSAINCLPTSGEAKFNRVTVADSF